MRLTLEIENIKNFIKNHKISETGSFFDAIPDEILYMILEKYIGMKRKKYNVSLYNLCLICKRFDRIVLDIMNKQKFCNIDPSTKKYIQFLENIDHWMEKILSFGLITSYRCLIFAIGKLIYKRDPFSREGSCIVFRFAKKAQIHSFILSNELYYYYCEDIYYLTFSAPKDTDIIKSITFIDYNLREYRVEKYSDKRVYASKHSGLLVDNTLAILTYNDKVFTADKEHYQLFKTNKCNFWIPVREMISEEIYELISGEFSPLPLAIFPQIITDTAHNNVQ